MKLLAIVVLTTLAVAPLMPAANTEDAFYTRLTTALVNDDMSTIEDETAKIADGLERLDAMINRAGDSMYTTRTIFDTLITMITNNLNPNSTAVTCFEDVIDVLKRSRAKEKPNWAKYWTDSRGRKVSGFQLGVIQFFGAPEECTRRGKVPHEDTALGKYLHFQPKFCRTPIKLVTDPTTNSSIPLAMGLCWPDTCQSQDLNEIIDAVANALKDPVCSLIPQLPQCSTREVATAKLNKLIPVSEQYWLEMELEQMARENDFKIKTPGESNREIVDILHSLGEFIDSRVSIGSIVCIKDELLELDEVAKVGFAVSAVVVGINVISLIFEMVYLICIVRPEYLSHEGKPRELMERPHWVFVDYSKKAWYIQVGTAASLIRNLIWIFRVDQSRSIRQLDHIAGLKAISLLWTILGHAYTYGALIINLDNILNYANDMRAATNQFVKQSQFAADTMFMLSAFMTTYIALRKLEFYKRKGASPTGFWVFFYLRRFFRIAPMIALIAYFYWALTPWTYIGITFPKHHDERCTSHMWTTILMLNNLVDTRKRCLGWTWWFGIDFQLFLLMPLFIIGFIIYPLIGIALAASLVAIHVATTAAIGLERGISSMMLTQAVDVLRSGGVAKEAFFDLYIVPWSRCGPIGIGILLGFIIFKTRFRSRINLFLSIALWGLSAAVVVALIYGLYPYQGDYKSMPRELDVTYLSLSRIAWAFCIAWIVFACSHGRGGLITKVLSAPIFQIVNKYSMTCFILHPILQEYFILARERLLHFMIVNMIWIYCGHVALASIIAIILCFGMERPIFNIVNSVIFDGIAKNVFKLPTVKLTKA